MISQWAAISCLMITLYSGAISAAEVDSFSNRNLNDVSSEINQLVNNSFQVAIDTANEKSPEACNPQYLMESLNTDFLGGGLG
ncbi:MAG: hypothetical protein ACXVCE_12450, partial [Bacteriovorax sp.]